MSRSVLLSTGLRRQQQRLSVRYFPVATSSCVTLCGRWRDDLWPVHLRQGTIVLLGRPIQLRAPLERSQALEVDWRIRRNVSTALLVFPTRPPLVFSSLCFSIVVWCLYRCVLRRNWESVSHAVLSWSVQSLARPRVIHSVCAVRRWLGVPNDGA
jgi:hypothetical protein